MNSYRASLRGWAVFQVLGCLRVLGYGLVMYGIEG